MLLVKSLKNGRLVCRNLGLSPRRNRIFNLFAEAKKVDQSVLTGAVKKDKDKNMVAFPEEFENRLKNWKHSLELEIEEEKKNLGALLLCECEFEFKNAVFSMDGGILELKFFDELPPDDYLAVSSFCKREGLPLRLSLTESSSAGPKELLSGIDVIFFELSKSSIKLRVKPKNFSLLRSLESMSVVYKISSSNKFPMTHLLELLSERNQWPKYPGYKLLLYCYRAKDMEPIKKDSEIKYFDTNLNEDQRLAVKGAMNPTRPITAIHGPPGTGKTKVISEIVAQLVHRNRKVLVCAPSHKAVFNVLRCCFERGLKDFCTVHGEVTEFTNNMDSLIEDHPLSSDLSKVYSHLNTTMEKVEENDLIEKAKSLMQDIQSDISKETMVVFCCLSSMAVKKFFNKGFSPYTVIVDEAGQATECASWPLIFHGKRMVVVGDHNQLPAVVKSIKAKRLGFDVSLIKWLSEEFGPDINFPLKKQYRFNSTIQSWPSKEFYDGNLEAHEKVADIQLSELLEKNDDEKLKHAINDPLVLVDTDLFDDEAAMLLSGQYNVPCLDGGIFTEQPLSLSKYNLGEAILCAHYLQSLLSQLAPSQIGCITPYKAQVSKIQSFLSTEIAENLDVSSVDAFQGQEREAIVMSFVRNNSNCDIGFINDFRRLNVAVTRAKRQFLLIASSRMLRSNPVLMRLSQTIEAKGRIVKPVELLQKL